jgi:FMN phosphatase YigB (HAD superfamily)
MSRERWATFDCYGTLIDWNGGIRRELARVFGEERADAQLERYHEFEPTLQAGGGRSYREVMTEAMAALGAPKGEEGGLAAALPEWRPFPEVRASLEHRSRLHRGVDRADRRSLRACHRRVGDRLVQAAPPALAAVPRRDGRSA